MRRSGPADSRWNCPPGVLDRLAGLEPDADLTAAFDLHPLPGTYRAGAFELTGVQLPHFVPNAGIRVARRRLGRVPRDRAAG
jgi:hypothetical protein